MVALSFNLLLSMLIDCIEYNTHVLLAKQKTSKFKCKFSLPTQPEGYESFIPYHFSEETNLTDNTVLELGEEKNDTLHSINVGRQQRRDGYVLGGRHKWKGEVEEEENVSCDVKTYLKLDLEGEAKIRTLCMVLFRSWPQFVDPRVQETLAFELDQCVFLFTMYMHLYLFVIK